MRRAVIVVVMLACGCESPPKHNVGPETPRQLSPPTPAQVEAAKTPDPTPEQAFFRRVATGTVADAEIPKLVTEAEKNRAITYAHLKKNADKYQDKVWGFRGKILEIGETDGKTKARISIDDYGNKVMFVEAPFDTEFVQDNRVDVLGVLMGNYSYTSQAGWNISIPALVAIRITKPGVMGSKRRRAVDDDE